MTMINSIVAFDDLSFGAVKHKFLVTKGFLIIGLLVMGELADTLLKMPTHNQPRHPDCAWNYGYFGLQALVVRRPLVRSLSFASMIWLIALLGTFRGNQFIYFQF